VGLDATRCAGIYRASLTRISVQPIIELALVDANLRADAQRGQSATEKPADGSLTDGEAFRYFSNGQQGARFDNGGHWVALLFG
jgi:hypothetical protein